MKTKINVEKGTQKQHENRADLFKFLCKINITARKACVLNTLAARGDNYMNRGELLAAMNMQGITPLIETLENDGLIERGGQKSDGRVVLIRLTEQGNYLADILATKWTN